MKKLILLSLLLLSVSLFGCAAKKSPQESSQASLQPQSQTPEDGDTPNDSSPTTTGVAEEPDVYSEVISLEGMNETVFYQKIAEASVIGFQWMWTALHLKRVKPPIDFSV
jgi:hypothetical protein